MGLSTSLAARGKRSCISSGHEAITAGLGHEYLCPRRISLDLLPKPVYVGFERMGRHARIVSPYLPQERVAADRLISGAIKIFEDRRFLLGQSYLFSAARMHEDLGAGPESVGTYHQYRIVAVLALPQMGTQSRQEDTEPERFCHIIVGSRIEAEDRVGIAVRAGQHNDRHLHAS